MRFHTARNDWREFFSKLCARIAETLGGIYAHLHKAYDAEFLAQLILRKKTQYYSQFAPLGGEF